MAKRSPAEDTTTIDATNGKGGKEITAIRMAASTQLTGASEPWVISAGKKVGKAVYSLFDKNEKDLKRLRPLVERINSMDLTGRSDEELQAMSDDLRQRLEAGVARRLSRFQEQEDVDAEEVERERYRAEQDLLDELLPEAFALVREVAARTIQLRPYDVQVLGAIILHRGHIAEMKTGEGKTLTATMPVYLNALTGRGVHVITVNDYLAERDANWMRPVYEFLGLSVAFITNAMRPDQRRAAYNADILYATNSEVGFDYLRDNMATTREELVQRPLHYAIVDEVDNILIDEARTPLIISAQVQLSERAKQKRAIAKVSDGVVRKLLPAIPELEVEAMVERFTSGTHVDLDALWAELMSSDAFERALDYLIESYIGPGDSPRTENIGRYKDVVDELVDLGLMTADGLSMVEAPLRNAPSAESLLELVDAQVSSTLRPASETIDGAMQVMRDHAEPDVTAQDALSAQLRSAGLLTGDRLENVTSMAFSGEWGDRLMAVIANEVVDELLEPGWIDNHVADAIGAGIIGRCEAGETLAFLHEQSLQGTGRLARAWQLVDELHAWEQDSSNPDDSAWVHEKARHVAELSRALSRDELLPAASLDRIWEALRLPVGRGEIKTTLRGALESCGGTTLAAMIQVFEAADKERNTQLRGLAKQLGEDLGELGAPDQNARRRMVQRAQSGAPGSELLAELKQALLKTSPSADVLRQLQSHVTERNRECARQASSLCQDLSEFIDGARSLRSGVEKALKAGGTTDQVQDRVATALRDAQVEGAEINSLISEHVQRVVSWREEQMDPLLDEIAEKAALAPPDVDDLISLLSEGADLETLTRRVSDSLLKLPAAAGALEQMERFLERREKLDESHGVAVREKLSAVAELPDGLIEALVTEAVGERRAPAAEAVRASVIDYVVESHLEPVLAPEYGEPLLEEITLRVTFSKDVRNRMSADDIIGRTRRQIREWVGEHARESLVALEFKDFKRAIKTLGWCAEVDEKQRNCSFTETGNLLAEQTIDRPDFPDPPNFGETLVETGLITETDLSRAQAKLADSNGQRALLDALTEVRAFDPMTRRRIVQLKLQEISSEMDNALKAHTLFHRDVDYVVQGGREIVIVDEFTGRLMPGRRYSEGLHEALEAKHGVQVRLESQTVATITIQNYFRLYHKLAGMTGTAKTEEGEFVKTYGLEVYSIPTNRPVVREDFPDIVLKTQEAKFRAIVGEILQLYWQGRPVLVGTRSVEVSERLSERLKPHNLQALALIQLVKAAIWESEGMSNAEKERLFTTLNPPLGELNIAHVRNLARQYNVPADVTAGENLRKLAAMLDHVSDDLDRLATALKRGLPHNVLNAKNHRNEARIIAEAARVGSITIATNMAGRGVDILLGGSLDDEARLRAVTRQILARRVEGRASHVRSRTDATTSALLGRLEPPMLQSLAWVTVLQDGVQSLMREQVLDAYKGKELLDLMAQSLERRDLKTRVAALARKMGLDEYLSLEAEDVDPQTLSRLLEILDVDEGAIDSLRNALTQGIRAYTVRNSHRERAFLSALLHRVEDETTALDLLEEALQATAPAGDELLQVCAEQADDMDLSALWRLAGSDDSSNGDHQNGGPDAVADEERVGQGLVDAVRSRLAPCPVSPAWLGGLLKELQIRSPADAREKLTDGQLLADAVFALAPLHAYVSERMEGAPPAEWVVERLQEHPAIKEVTYHADVDGAAGQQLGAFFRFDRARLADEPSLPRTEGVAVVAPHELSDRVRLTDRRAEWATEQWANDLLYDLKIVRLKNEVHPRMPLDQILLSMGGAEFEPAPVYVVRRERVHDFLAQLVLETIVGLAVETEEETIPLDAVRAALARGEDDPLLRVMTDEWLSDRVGECEYASLDGGSIRVDRSRLPDVVVESGVAGQAADHVLVGGVRPEDLLPPREQEQVKSMGGLHILGTERHESRRIDNQLRGRAGRQGDPGSSRFYVSLEDELMRLFGSRPKFLMDRWPEDEPVEARIVSKSIEHAQKKVETNHFESRKHTLQYDDVMNVQREVVYGERRQALLGEDVSATVVRMMRETAAAEVDKYTPPDVDPREWDVPRLEQSLERLFGVCELRDFLDLDELRQAGPREIKELVQEAIEAAYRWRAEQLGPDLMREVERYRVCEAIDDHWMQHLAEMDYLKEGIQLRAYGQRQPLLEYKREAYDMFQGMMAEVARDVTEFVLQVPREVAAQVSMARRQRRLRSMQMRWGELHDASAEETYTRSETKVGRNEPCPCGSGKKYKKCCLLKEKVTA